ncbi:prepilin-type N-terminal cleavage/methylation domain-containing protein [Vibrio vulnificus]|uniref:prepilin-type N-terminal cleavage/methylation domain-containing protein n=1 Tax=Vibrio vulnificus TaxID=672 RepID=UPI000C7A2A00|nr:prepilin-type N-terminal cleavage/methylation domain-containing protein [Vibrio vulnificus]AUL96761.1 MSHA pilin protein MshB [Vibrio vulnificus]EHH0849091.1 prepilin-type N-terminal cleavage/methylation domain-containing protein [Vibrio vulnificus]EIZ1411010.1 prepilin-type N-terminal cleavage/methylation domain-containing protein [Vibrio vulnificus]EJA3296376.1 prepilin-type N-terminal cleavage/methylation domain-containing protein [Vibrio vulnificus]EJE8670183.1 prepilin-type N-terminal 
MKQNQNGFSLVELVVVIVVVGLLAVAALPRFLDVTDAAKKASIEGVAGGFATGVLSARAQWEAEARPSRNINSQEQNTVNYDGVDFWLTRSKDASNADTGFRDGYPWGLAGNFASYPASLTGQMCVDLMENLLQNPPKVGIEGSGTTSDNGFKYSASADSVNAKCTYIQLDGNTQHQFEYEAKNGRVTVTLQ